MNRNVTRVGIAVLLVLCYRNRGVYDDLPDGLEPGGAGAAAAAAAPVGKSRRRHRRALRHQFSTFADFVAEPGTYSGVLINDGTINTTHLRRREPTCRRRRIHEFEFTVPPKVSAAGADPRA
jgi:hypothetical protein